MLIEILSSPGCPNAAAAHEMLVDGLAVVGINTAIIERVGPFPSPSVLIDGTDVMRPDRPPTGDFCRLDLAQPRRHSYRATTGDWRLRPKASVREGHT